MVLEELSLCYKNSLSSQKIPVQPESQPRLLAQLADINVYNYSKPICLPVCVCVVC